MRSRPSICAGGHRRRRRSFDSGIFPVAASDATVLSPRARSKTLSDDDLATQAAAALFSALPPLPPPRLGRRRLLRSVSAGHRPFASLAAALAAPRPRRLQQLRASAACPPATAAVAPWLAPTQAPRLLRLAHAGRLGAADVAVEKRAMAERHHEPRCLRRMRKELLEERSAPVCRFPLR
eukprot:PLAT1214.1.p1 GENE.PLAT1214.1~~PLAT1214.1.p1  ORF type:complete len:180 (-),score=44.21 PLAT1214.1:345-884(-)